MIWHRWMIDHPLRGRARQAKRKSLHVPLLSAKIVAEHSYFQNERDDFICVV
jgi:hypothetical protein